LFNNRVGSDFSAVNMFAPQWDEDTQQYQKNEDGTFAPQGFEYTYKADNPTDLYSDLISGAQKLANGNMLICSGIQFTVYEINPENEIVWKYINPVRGFSGGFETQGTENPRSGLLFRFNRYAPDFPGFQDKDLTAGEFIELEPDGQLCPVHLSVPNTYISTLKVYPNPAKNYLIIEGEQPHQQVILYNLKGSKIVEYHKHEQKIKIPLQQIESGCYLLSVDNLFFNKIIIQ